MKFATIKHQSDYVTAVVDPATETYWPLDEIFSALPP